MLRLAGPFITCSLALASTSAIAQAGATPPSPSGEAAAQRTQGREQPASAPSVANELCPSLEQAAAENGLPLDFFVRVIWQESRFNALWRISGFVVRRRHPNSSTQKRLPPGATYLF